MIFTTDCLKCFQGIERYSKLGLISSGKLEEIECKNDGVDDDLYKGGFVCVKNSGCRISR